MPFSVAIPPVLSAWLIETLRVDSLRDVRSTVGGFSNLTFSALVGDGRVVVKAANNELKRADLRREAAMLGRVAAEETLRVPNIRAHADVEDWTVLVLDWVDGEPGLNVLQAGQSGAGVTVVGGPRGPILPATKTRTGTARRSDGRDDASPETIDLVRCGAVLGKLLQAVHQTAPQPLSGHLAMLSDRNAHLRERLDSLGFEGETLEVLRNALSSPILDRGVALVHGDFGFHNCLWNLQTGSVASLIDWEFSGWGNPLADVAWTWWTLSFRRIGPDAIDTFLRNYGHFALRALGWSNDVVRVLVTAQMAHLLARTEPGSSGRREWLRRLDALGAMTVASLD